MCADGYFYEDYDEDMELVNGECPDCGALTIDGEAASGCAHAWDRCETCGHGTCDGGC